MVRPFTQYFPPGCDPVIMKEEADHRAFSKIFDQIRHHVPDLFKITASQGYVELPISYTCKANITTSNVNGVGQACVRLFRKAYPDNRDSVDFSTDIDYTGNFVDKERHKEELDKLMKSEDICESDKITLIEIFRAVSKILTPNSLRYIRGDK